MKKTMFLFISLAMCLCASASAIESPAVSPSLPKLPAPAAVPDVPAPLAGKVLQTMDGGGYTYIHIEQKDGKKVWVAVTQTAVKVGNQMSFQPGVEMTKFESKALNRSFDSIIFSNGVLSGGPAPVVPGPGKNKGVSPGSRGAVGDKAAKISVTRATGPNAVTIAEAYSNSAKLNNKKVVIHGQVVKVSSGIMGKNWIHIQDGTGSGKMKTHNLVCTSKTDIADIGDVVTINGTLVKDRDFGSGYKYAVIIEDAKIAK